MKSELFLPALTGRYGQWRFFEAIVPISFITMNEEIGGKTSYFVKTVSEVEEVYSSRGLGHLLQRALDVKRLKPLVGYLKQQGDRYINNLTIAFFDGDPEWMPINVSTAKLQDELADNNEVAWEEIEKRFGIIRFTGSEKLFVLDGQHRVVALRAAVEQNPELSKDEIAITLISHKNTDNGREKTRRLFTTINRYAKPVAKGEYILLDEDDLSAIVTRKVIEEHPTFLGKKLIALTKTSNLAVNDFEHLSTVCALYDICERLIPKTIYAPVIGDKSSRIRTRPNEDIIKEYSERVFNFWNWFFKVFPDAAKYADKNDFSIRKDGGQYFIRPIGQLLLATFYNTVFETGRIENLNMIVKVPHSVRDKYWEHILFNPTENKMKVAPSLAKKYLFYSLRIPMKESEKTKLIEKYRALTKNDNAMPTIL